MKIITLFVIACLSAFGAGPVISSIAADSPSKSQVRIRYTSDAVSTTVLDYGTTTGYGSSLSDSGSYTAHSLILGGLAGGTTYHYRITATSAGGTTVGTDQTFTTAVQTPIQLATLPTEVVTTGPVSFTATASVSTCAGIQTQINTYAGNDGNNNYRIDIDPSLSCTGQITLPLKTGANPTGTGVIVLQGAGVYSPSNARVATTDQLPTLYANRVAARLLPSTPTDCFFLGDLYWDDDESTFALKQCTSQSPVTYTTITAVGSGTSLPGTCSDGDWYYKTDAGSHNNRAFWCIGANTWRQVLFVGDGEADTSYAALSVATNAKGYRIQGLRIATIGFPAAYTSSLTQHSRTIGSVNRCLATAPKTSTGVIFDRVVFDGVQFPYRTVYGLCPLDGTNNAVINSYFNDLNRPLTDSSYEATANCIIMYDGPGPIAVVNNYFKNCHGMSVFVSDETTANVNPSDVVLRANVMYEDPCHNANDPCATAGRYWERRNQVELKRGVRWLFEGNLFSGGWASVTRGSCLSLTPRPGNVSVANNSIQIKDITVRNNWFAWCMEPLSIAGANDSYSLQTLAAQRITITNNLFSDSSVSSTGVTTGWPSSLTSRGYLHLIQYNPEDVTISRNTYWNAYGSDRADLHLFLDAKTGSGLNLSGNIYNPSVAGSSINGSFTASGTATLDAYWKSGGSTNYSMLVNYMFQQTGVNPANFPAGQVWYTSTSSFALQDTANSNYRPTMASPARSAGWDQDAFRALSGEAYNLRVLSITSSGATIYWTAPDAVNACTIEYGTSATAGTGTRVLDIPTSRFRSKAISGLSTGTLYYIRTYCGQMSSTSFTTL